MIDGERGKEEDKKQNDLICSSVSVIAYVKNFRKI